jgi:adenosylhomocysteine nucleosidase
MSNAGDAAGPVAVLSALPVELEHLVEQLDHRKQQPLASGTAWCGQLGGRDTVLALSGMGKVAAALVATSLIETTRPCALIFSGVAGGLDPHLDVGDIVIAERVVQHDTGVLTDRGLDRYQAAHLPFLNPTGDFGWPCASDLVDRALAAARDVGLDPLPADAGGHDRPPQVVRGVVATGDVFVNGPAVKRRLHADLGAHVAEMEGGAVAQVAATIGVPQLVVRAVTDNADGTGPADFEQFAHHAAANSARIVERLVVTTPSSVRSGRAG